MWNNNKKCIRNEIPTDLIEKYNNLKPPTLSRCTQYTVANNWKMAFFLNPKDVNLK